MSLITQVSTFTPHCTEIELYREVYGAGPQLVFGHGFGGSARNFRPQARFLEKHYRVCLFDARGHARSPAPAQPGAYGLSCFLNDLDHIVQESGSGQAVVGGLSMGSAIALHYALHHPGRVAGLVLASYPAGPKNRDWALGFATAIEKNGLDQAGAEYVWAERSRFDPRGAALIRQGFMEHSAAAISLILRELLAELPPITALRSTLQRMNVPTLLVAGAHDHTAIESSRELQAIIPNAALHVIPNAGHIVNIEQAEAFNTVLSSFLAPILAQVGER